LSSERDEPLLGRDDLKQAAQRALFAATPLVAWAATWRSKGALPTVALGLALAGVVFATSLVERLAARRAWPVARLVLVVALVGCAGAFGAVLQARASGIDLLQEGAGVARLERELATVWLAKGLRLPAAFGALLASGAAATCALRGPRGRLTAGLVLAVGALGAYPALWAIMGRVGSDAERALLLLQGGGAVLLGLELAWRARRPGSPEITARSPGGGVDVALAAVAVLLLLLPRGGRLAQDIQRANDQAEAQRLYEAALATPDAGAALLLLDRSILLSDDPRVRLDRGVRRAAQGSIADAEEDFAVAALRGVRLDKGRGTDTTDVGQEDDFGLRLDALVAWGDALFHDYDRALSSLANYTTVVKTIEETPELAESHAGLVRHALSRKAALHVALRDDLLAQNAATRLLDLEFRAPGAWLRRGVVRAIAGDVEGARADLARAADSPSADGAHAALWAAALWGEGGAGLDAVVLRPDWLGAAGRVLAPPSDDIVPNERDLLAGALAQKDDPEGALASAQAWLGAQAERAGDTARARERYTAAVAACARRAPTGIKRPHPGDHLGGLWAWRRLEALR
jgi:tetratricopeptide (TPR) repeat protein